MTKRGTFLLKYHLGLVTILLSIRKISSQDMSHEQRTALYEKCEIFNSTDLYDGVICGTDGETYSNAMFLDCLNHQQRKDVATWHRGACPPGAEYCEPKLIYEPVCGSDSKTWSNLESLLCHRRLYASKLKMVSKGACKVMDYCNRHGFDTYGINPVCGSNGYTYQNIAQLKCLQNSQPGLEPLHDGGCTVKTVYRLYGNGERVCEIAENRYEWNPVCGSDGKTHPNPFVFLCSNPDIQVRSNSECNTPSHLACIKANENATMVDGERVDGNSDPDEDVCGIDGRTYKSSNHLICHTINNKHLYLKHRGPCVGPDDNPCHAIPHEDKRFPVCGSDGETYISPEALWCAKRRKKDKKLAFVHDGPC